MKLFVINRQTENKIYLNLLAFTRDELTKLVGGSSFYLGDNLYRIDEVFAESDDNNTATGAIIGGAVGVIGGPVGILIGGFLGGLIGNGTDESEKLKILRFNQS